MGTEIEKYAQEKSIKNVINTCHDINPTMTDSQIKDYLIRKFGLTENDAEKYFVLSPA